MRSMVSSLSQSIDKVSEINNEISQDELIKKFPNLYQLCNKDLNKLITKRCLSLLIHG